MGFGNGGGFSGMVDPQNPKRDMAIVEGTIQI
jgi:hypothetical protein